MKQPKTFVMGDPAITVDWEDRELLLRYSWSLKDGQYPRAKVGGKKVFLHRLLMGFPDCLVDHINRDPLDNRRSNLRLADKSLNSFNAKIRCTNTSGTCGVSFKKDRNKWNAYIKKNGRRKHLGYFINIKEAIEARKQAEKEIYGEIPAR